MIRTDPVAAGDWHADPRVVALVEAVAPRDVAVELSESKTAASMSALPPVDRATSAAEVFAGLVDETNRQRDRQQPAGPDATRARYVGHHRPRDRQHAEPAGGCRRRHTRGGQAASSSADPLIRGRSERCATPARCRSAWKGGLDALRGRCRETQTRHPIKLRANRSASSTRALPADGEAGSRMTISTFAMFGPGRSAVEVLRPSVVARAQEHVVDAVVKR